MLRSAAKNYADVTVVCNPADYPKIIGEIRANGNATLRNALKIECKSLHAHRRIRYVHRHFYA